jgi:hypothetical protein
VASFKGFLANLPVDALCQRRGKRYVAVGEDGYTPFRPPPSLSSRADIEHFLHAMLRTWNAMGYMRFNPMALEGAGARRKVNARRSVAVDVFKVVIDTMADAGADTLTRMVTARDRLILVALREPGLRASELVGLTGLMAWGMTRVLVRARDSPAVIVHVYTESM